MQPSKTPLKDPGKVADFILFSQREFLLNLSKELSSGNVSFRQFYMLGYLSVHPELTMGEIAKAAEMEDDSATILVDHLEGEGFKYLERFRKEEDKRKIYVRITTAGREFLTRLRQAIVARIAETMEGEQLPNIDALFHWSEKNPSGNNRK